MALRFQYEKKTKTSLQWLVDLLPTFLHSGARCESYSKYDVVEPRAWVGHRVIRNNTTGQRYKSPHHRALSAFLTKRIARPNAIAIVWKNTAPWASIPLVVFKGSLKSENISTLLLALQPILFSTNFWNKIGLVKRCFLSSAHFTTFREKSFSRNFPHSRKARRFPNCNGICRESLSINDESQDRKKRAGHLV